MLSRCKLAANETMKKDISFDTEMENGYKEKYKKKDISCKKKKKQNRSMALQTLNKTELKANRSQKTMKNLIY